MLGHQSDQFGIALVSRETQCLECLVVASQNLRGSNTKEPKQIANLSLGEWFLFVVAVLKIDFVLSEQGDRLAAGASGVCADELDHVGCLGDGGVAWCEMKSRR